MGGIVDMFTGGGKSATAPTTAPTIVTTESENVSTPEKSSSEVQSLADEQRQRIYKTSSGRASTMLSSADGASTATTSKAVRMLGSSGGY